MVVASPAESPILTFGDRPRPNRAGNRERSLRNARETFLRTRRVSSVVRPEIAGSWRRSVLCGVSPDAALPEYVTNVNFDCQLMRIARPVLEEREIAIAETRCSMVLTDAEARVLARWGSDEELERELTRIEVLPGFCIAESVVGTNSAALALEMGVPAAVHGPEHLAEAYADLSSVGAPITHPLSRRLLGTLNVVCRCEDATPLLMPWLLEVIREIERRLRVEGCVQEQLLLESYLTAKRDCRHPVVCLNDQTILSNSAAARLLGAVDKALLWEQASRAIQERANEVSTFVLSDGQRASAHCHPIFDGLSPVGAKIEIQLDQAREPVVDNRAPSATADGALATLAGRGVRWQRLCEEATRAKANGSRLLLVGEAGSGKLAIARALFADEHVDVFDAALLVVETPGAWLRRLHDRLRHPGGVVVLQHLEALDAFTARTVASVVQIVGDDGPRIVGTLTGDATTLDVFDTVVAVPALRDRMEDLRELLQVLTRRHTSGTGTWQWMPDAIQTLSRVDWPGNVRGLEMVIKQVVGDRTPGYIDARRLPASVRATASRRRLSRLEQLEAAAITEALQHSRGNKLEAAQSLGIARSTLYRRMRSLGIDLTEANY